MKFILIALAAAVSAAPLAAPVANAALVARQESDFMTKLLCAHDHLHTSQTCNDLKKAAGDKGVIADLLGYSTF